MNGGCNMLRPYGHSVRTSCHPGALITDRWQHLTSRYQLQIAGCIASYQIRKIAGCACAGNARNIFPATVGYRSPHAPRNRWCMPGSITSGFLWSRWRGIRSQHSRCMRNPQFYISGKRPMGDQELKQCSRSILMNITPGARFVIGIRKKKLFKFRYNIKSLT